MRCFLDCSMLPSGRSADWSFCLLSGSMRWRTATGCSDGESTLASTFASVALGEIKSLRVSRCSLLISHCSFLKEAYDRKIRGSKSARDCRCIPRSHPEITEACGRDRDGPKLFETQLPPLYLAASSCRIA